MKSSTFQPTSVLLDKGVIRRVYERRVRMVLGKPPTVLQVEAANSYAYFATIANRLYITEQTANILKRRTQVFAAPLLAETRPLKKARYLRRWARRLTEFAFSPEDAIVLAYGSFGLDVESKSVGVDVIITTDIRLAEHYERRHAEITNRFDNMIVNLPEAYAVMKLPQVVTTAAILSLVYTKRLEQQLEATIIEQRQSLELFWGEICQLPRQQRVALLLNLRNPQGIIIITLLPATGVATFEQIAQALEIPPAEFEQLWAQLPLDDLHIAAYLGATRQQVIHLRKTARERLLERMSGLTGLTE